MQSADDLVAAICKHERALRTLGYRVRFDLTDTNAVILLDATGGAMDVAEAGGDADTVLALSSDDLGRLIAGKLSPTLAFATGRLKIEGSRGVALKLAGLLDGE